MNEQQLKYNIAVYPGSFDPCTNGHLDIIRRAGGIFDKLIVTVLVNSAKTATFSADERIAMLKTVTEEFKNVEIDCFSGLLVDYAKKVNASCIIKGLRAVSDFEYEFQMALTNKDLDSNIETMLIPANKEYMFLSSSIVKEVGKFGGQLKKLVPPQILDIIVEKIRDER